MKFWSQKVLIGMLEKMRLPFFKARLQDLTDGEWNELADWAYYHAAQEPDFLPKRSVYPALVKILNRSKVDQVCGRFGVAMPESIAVAQEKRKRSRKEAAS